MQPTQPDTDLMVSTLNGLIETAKDGASGFEAAARDCTNSDLKHLFSQISRERAGFSTKLQSFLEDRGEDTAKSGTLAAAVHRGWINLKSTLASRDNLAVLEECERGEDYAVKRYQDALEGLKLGSATETVKLQSDRVLQAHNRVKAMKTKFAATPAAH